MMRVRSLSAGIALAIVIAPSVAGASSSDARRACTALGTKAATRRVLTAAANNLEHVKTAGAHGQAKALKKAAKQNVFFRTAASNHAKEWCAAHGFATSPNTTSTTAGPISYQVKRGDTLTTIARQFGVTVQAILALNQVPNPDRLAEGQTLVIPPRPPVALEVTPTEGPVGQGFQLKLTGAKAGESVTFDITSPKGKFTGRPHTASADGTVTATYQTSIADASGMYTVVANGSEGTTAQATFRVTAAKP